MFMKTKPAPTSQYRTFGDMPGVQKVQKEIDGVQARLASNRETLEALEADLAEVPRKGLNALDQDAAAMLAGRKLPSTLRLEIAVKHQEKRVLERALEMQSAPLAEARRLAMHELAAERAPAHKEKVDAVREAMKVLRDAVRDHKAFLDELEADHISCDAHPLRDTRPLFLGNGVGKDELTWHLDRYINETNDYV